MTLEIASTSAIVGWALCWGSMGSWILRAMHARDIPVAKQIRALLWILVHSYFSILLVTGFICYHFGEFNYWLLDVLALMVVFVTGVGSTENVRKISNGERWS